MDFVVNLTKSDVHPGEWAKQREGQGWKYLSIADHFVLNTPYPHVWVGASAMAMATESAVITTAFVNNLFRSPVEVAQASLYLHEVSGGRFELGMGAGWARDEVVQSGLDYPGPGERAGRFAEAVQILRPLLAGQPCRFQGEYYDIDLPAMGAPSTPVPLVGSVGGPRTVREVTPHCDRVEIKASSSTTRGGALDLPAMAHIPDQHLIDMIDRVRAVDPDIPINMFGLCNAVDDEATRGMSAMLGDSLYSRFFGPPEHVADGMAWLEELGIDRVQLSCFDTASLDNLAPLLVGR